MRKRKSNQAALCGLLAAAMFLALHSSAWAVSSEQTRIVTNPGTGAAGAIALGTPQTSVVELFLGGGLCSGSLIDATHILTAQHCTNGVATGAMTVNFHTDNDGAPDATRAVSAKAEVPGYAGPGLPGLVNGTDLAVLTLAAAAPGGIPFLPLAVTNPTGVTARAVGFGLNGVAPAGHGGTADGLRWATDNTIDFFGFALISGSTAIGGSANIFNTDFDDGTALANTLGAAPTSSSPVPVANEGTTAPGDSGGPLLVNGVIVGVLSGGTTQFSTPGDISWWTGTTNLRTFIARHAPGAVFVPEPSTYILVALGIAVVGLVNTYGQRRRKLA